MYFFKKCLHVLLYFMEYARVPHPPQQRVHPQLDAALADLAAAATARVTRTPSSSRAS